MGLKIIDGTPTEISKYLREEEFENDIKECLKIGFKEGNWNNRKIEGCWTPIKKSVKQAIQKGRQIEREEIKKIVLKWTKDLDNEIDIFGITQFKFGDKQLQELLNSLGEKDE